ncbi:MAG: polysaccharide biosynthesis/export family protein, partial [Thermodesulfobacteriota bacterium]
MTRVKPRRRRTTGRRLLSMALTAAFLAAFFFPGQAASAATPPAPGGARAERPLYVIGPEDVLEISVWKNADLSKVVTVRPDGKISLPLVGDLMAAG